jgi:hypothetical protein
VGTVTDGAEAGRGRGRVVYTKVDGTPNEWRNVAARTGPDGTYRVEGLAPCLLSALLVDAEGFAPISILRNTPLASGVTERWDVRLFRGATLEGRVLGEDGSPSRRDVHGALSGQPAARSRGSALECRGRFVLEASPRRGRVAGTSGRLVRRGA